MKCKKIIYDVYIILILFRMEMHLFSGLLVESSSKDSLVIQLSQGADVNCYSNNNNVGTVIL